MKKDEQENEEKLNFDSPLLTQDAIQFNSFVRLKNSARYVARRWLMPRRLLAPLCVAEEHAEKEAAAAVDSNALQCCLYLFPTDSLESGVRKVHSLLNSETKAENNQKLTAKSIESSTFELFNG